MPWGGVGGTDDKVEGRWSWKDGEAYQSARYAEIESGAPPKTKNPYDMHEKRKEIWHWRELSQKLKPVIPINDVPNELWYK